MLWSKAENRFILVPVSLGGIPNTTVLAENYLSIFHFHPLRFMVGSWRTEGECGSVGLQQENSSRISDLNRIYNRELVKQVLENQKVKKDAKGTEQYLQKAAISPALGKQEVWDSYSLGAWRRPSELRDPQRPFDL